MKNKSTVKPQKKTKFEPGNKKRKKSSRHIQESELRSSTLKNGKAFQIKIKLIFGLSSLRTKMGQFFYRDKKNRTLHGLGEVKKNQAMIRLLVDNL